MIEPPDPATLIKIPGYPIYGLDDEYRVWHRVPPQGFPHKPLTVFEDRNRLVVTMRNTDKQRRNVAVTWLMDVVTKDKAMKDPVKYADWLKKHLDYTGKAEEAMLVELPPNLVKIPGFKLYGISDEGDVWRLVTPARGPMAGLYRPLRPNVALRGRSYTVIVEGDDGKRRRVPIHKLHRLAFGEEPGFKPIGSLPPKERVEEPEEESKMDWTGRDPNTGKLLPGRDRITGELLPGYNPEDDNDDDGT